MVDKIEEVFEEVKEAVKTPPFKPVSMLELREADRAIAENTARENLEKELAKMESLQKELTARKKAMGAK